MGISQKLYETAKIFIPGGTQLLTKRPEMFLPNLWPAYYSSCKGCEIHDLDNNKYIDMSYMGIGSCILGYADSYVDNIVINAIRRGSMSTLNCAEEVLLAKKLCELHQWAKMVRYARTGGEAMAIAVRIARTKTGRELILFCGYHGWHDWYLSANLTKDNALEGHLLPGLEPNGIPKALKDTSIPFKYNDHDGIKKLFDKYKNNIAAVIMEPMRNYWPKNDFLKLIRDLADTYNVVLVFDEITSGWRMCVGGIHQLLFVNPDIAVFAKAISNGYPMAAIIGKASVMNAIQNTFVSSTYWTERIGPVAALATISKLEKRNVPSCLQKIGNTVKDGWKNLSKKHNIKINISGISPLSHFEFHSIYNPLILKTLLTQYMLDEAYLATNTLYASYAHDGYVDEYLSAMDRSFAKISDAISSGNPGKYLNGPICHAGFNRLN